MGDETRQAVVTAMYWVIAKPVHPDGTIGDESTSRNQLMPRTSAAKASEDIDVSMASLADFAARPAAVPKIYRKISVPPDPPAAWALLAADQRSKQANVF